LYFGFFFKKQQNVRKKVKSYKNQSLEIKGVQINKIIMNCKKKKIIMINLCVFMKIKD
jgi:hypothetical protein